MADIQEYRRERDRKTPMSEHREAIPGGESSVPSAEANAKAPETTMPLGDRSQWTPEQWAKSVTYRLGLDVQLPYVCPAVEEHITLALREYGAKQRQEGYNEGYWEGSSDETSSK